MDSANFSTFRRYVVDREVDKAADIAVDNWTWRLTRWPAWWWTVDTLSTTPLGVFVFFVFVFVYPQG